MNRLHINYDNDKQEAIDSLLVLLFYLEVVSKDDYMDVYTYDEYDAFIMRMKNG